jgi:ADP-heptose:LPS heptosyltransferase
LSPAAFFEKTIKKIFWKGLGPKASSAGPFHLKAGMSVLALRPDRLGDFILSTPALQALEKALGPTGRLTVVAGERNESIAKYFFPRAEILVSRKSFLNRFFLFLALKRRSFDLVLDFHSYPFSTTSALMALCPNCVHRVGFWDEAGQRDLSRRVFNLGVPPPPANLHEMEKSFLLLKPLGLKPPQTQISFKIPNVPAAVREQVKFFYKCIGVGPETILLALHPTLQKEDNRWAIGKYVELSQRMASHPRIKILVVHGKGEEENLQRFKELSSKIQNLFILPQADVFFILEAARRFDLFVCNDSGLMHLAALVTKVLVVFGPSEPRRWGPLKVGVLRPKVLRAKDHQCDSVEVAEVLREVRKILSPR